MEENLWNRYSCIPNGNIHSESSVTPEISEVGDDCDVPVKVEPYNQFKADLLLPGSWFYPTDEDLIEFFLQRKTEKISVHIDDIYKYDPWKLPESNTVEDKEWYYYCKRGRKYKNSLRPNRVTGSGFWKATGVDKPIYSSTVNTRRVNNWRNDHNYLRCYPQSPTTSSSEFISTFNSMNKQQQLFELQKYLVSKYGNGHDCNSSSCETSTKSHHPHVPEFNIDILDGNDHLDVWRGANGHSDFIVYQAWNEYKNRLKNSKFDDDAMKIMSGIFAAVAGQVVAGVMVNRLSSSPSSSWAGPVVEVATVLGLSVTLVGTTLRGKSRALSTLVIKIGALTIASAIILSMGLHLPPAMAWTLGTVAFLIMAVAAALA